MELERALLLAVRRPRTERQADIDKCRIERIQRIREPEPVPGREIAALLQKSVKHLLEDIGVPVGVRVRQRTSGNAGQPEMIPLARMASQADLNIAETAQPLRLGKQERQQLLPAGKPLDIPVAVMPINALFELVPTYELHYLRKYCIPIHGQPPF